MPQEIEKRTSGLFHSSCGASMQSVADGCILHVSSHTPSAAPAMGDGSCAARLTSRSTEYDATVLGNLTGSRGVVGENQIKENTNEPTSSNSNAPAKAPVPVKQSATDDVFEQIQQTYDSIARRAFEIFDNNGRGPVTNWKIGSVPSPNCCTLYTWKWQNQTTT